MKSADASARTPRIGEADGRGAVSRYFRGPFAPFGFGFGLGLGLGG